MKHHLLAAVAATIFAITPCEVMAQSLQPMKSPEGLWGLKDASGAAVVAPKFQQIRPFHRGFAATSIKDSAGTTLWGLVDIVGREVMPPKYTNLVIDSQWVRFSVPGRDAAGGLTEFWGAVNHQGKVVVQPNLIYIGELKNGRASFRRDTSWGFLAADGREAVVPRFRYQSDFYQGLARATVDGKLYGYIDSNGIELVPFTYESATDFSDGFAVVETADTKDVIATSGKVSLPCLVRCKVYEVRGTKKAGLVVGNLEDKFGIADRAGKVLQAPKYEGITASDTGSVWNYREKGLWGLIDARTGKTLTKPLWKEVGEFRTTLIPVLADSVANFWAYADRKGKLVTPVQFLKAGPLSDGLAPAVLPDPAAAMREWVFVDATGKVTLRTGLPYPQYTVMGFDRGCAKVRGASSDGFDVAELGCIDRMGMRWFNAP